MAGGRVSLEGLQCFPAISIGHHHIQGDDLRLEIAGQVKGLLAASSAYDLVAAVAVEVALEETDGILVIVNHQHRRPAGGG